MFPPLVIFLVWKSAHSLMPNNKSVFCVPVAEEEGEHRKACWGNRQLENLSSAQSGSRAAHGDTVTDSRRLGLNGFLSFSS